MIKIKILEWDGSFDELKEILKSGMKLEVLEKDNDGSYSVSGEKKENFRTGRPPRIDKEEVKNLQKMGLTHKKIAEKLGCSRGYVTALLNKKDIADEATSEEIIDEKTKQELREMLRKSYGA